MPKLSYAVFGILGFTALFKKSANAQMIDGKIVMVNGGAKYQESAFGSKKVNVVVVDEQNNPVPNAIVDIKINDAVMSTAVTSSKGECSNMVEIESSGYSLIDIEVSADGYKQKVVKQIRVSKDNQTYRVKLDEEVIIMGKFKVDDLHFPDYTNPEQEPVIIEPVKCNSEAGITIDQPTLILINPYPEVQPMKELDIYMDQESISEEVAPRFQLENNTLSFIAFPNPTIADLTIQTKEELTFDIKIFNENGALVLQLLNQYQRAQISLEGSAAGNYFAMIFINNKAIETHKIILIR